MGEDEGGGDDKIIPLTLTLTLGERVGHSFPQQSWRVFWHILIKTYSNFFTFDLPASVV